jgi:hypothetical protein
MPEWQRLVACNVNPLINSQFSIDSSKLTYTGNAHKLLRINSTADGVELSSDLDTVTFSQAGTQVAATATTGIDLSTGKALSVNGTQVVAARDTGWTADTGTSEKTAHATYTKGLNPYLHRPPDCGGNVGAGNTDRPDRTGRAGFQQGPKGDQGGDHGPRPHRRIMQVNYLPDPEQHPLWPQIRALLEPAAKFGDVAVECPNQVIWIAHEDGTVFAAATSCSLRHG